MIKIEINKENNILLFHEHISFSDPLRANALTSGQKQALALYNSSRAEPQGEYKNAKNKNFPYIEDIAPIIEWFDCINDNEKLIVKEGRRSFPSGHTSFIFAGAVFCALYSGYWLGTWRSSLALGMGSKSRNFPGVSAKLATVFVFLLPAIYVGASRTQVNNTQKHFILFLKGLSTSSDRRYCRRHNWQCYNFYHLFPVLQFSPNVAIEFTHQKCFYSSKIIIFIC